MTAPTKRLNVGIIGAGFVATAVHIPFLKQLPAANILAVADSAPGRALAVASQFGIPLHSTDYATLLRNEDISIVDICTPPQFHSPIAVEAIDAEKNVIVEKPLAMNLAELGAIREALSRTARSHIGAVLNLRYMPLVHSVLQVLHSGRLGEIKNVSASVHTVAPPTANWFSDPVLSRYGVLYDYLPHVIDLVLWALQARPIAVRCLASSLGGGFYLIVDLRSPLTNDFSLLVDVAWTSATSIRALQFWGTERDLFVDLQDHFWYLGRGHVTPVNRFEEFARRIAGLAKRATGGRISIKYGGMAYHRDLLRDFLAAFADGRCPPVSLSDAFFHVSVIDAAVRSHMAQRSITVSAE